MNPAQFSSIENKLNMVIKLLAIQAIGDKEYRQQVTLLDSMGLQPKEIADLTGKSVNNVNVTLHLIRKAKKKGGKKDE
ncbi:MAG: hypothetical protein KAT77_06520 [Nanoarchaeota archaeon]|nr:hypothetical protein [Nanoarchaeota archaeon]